MSDLYSDHNLNLSNILADIKEGSLSVPDLQRPFVWDKSKIRDLLDSMFKGYPIGYLMLWEPLDTHEKSHNIGTADHTYDRPTKLILDGQQRLTGLYAAMYGVPVIDKKFKQTAIVISFNPLTGQFDVADAAIRKDPEWLYDISKMFTEDNYDVQEAYFERLQEAYKKDGKELPHETRKVITQNLRMLYGLREYKIPTLEVNKNADEEMVSDIFVRVNSGGAKLSEDDFILTLMSVHWTEGRKLLETFCKNVQEPGNPAFNWLYQPETSHIIRTVMSYGFKRGRLKYAYMLLRGKDLETGLISEENQLAMFDKLKEAIATVLNIEVWKEFLRCANAAGYISEKQLSSKNALAYCYAMFLIGKFNFKVDQKTLRNVIARWIYMSLVTGRYTNSPETKMEQDLADMRSISTADEFKEYIDRKILSQLTDDYFNITVPEEISTSASNSPEWNGYIAALNVLGAKVMFSTLQVKDLFIESANGNKNALEKHHLFPREYLKRTGITESRQINRIANMAYIEWGDNIQISGDAPSIYFPPQLARMNYSETEIKELYHFNALPENWETLDYQEFLEKRQKLIGQIVKEGYAKLLQMA